MVSPADMEVNFNYVRCVSRDLKTLCKELDDNFGGFNWMLGDIDKIWKCSISNVFMNKFISLNKHYDELLCNIIKEYYAYLDTCVECKYTNKEIDNTDLSKNLV